MMVVFHPLAVRYFLMSVHYRTSLTYTKHELEVSSDSLYNVYQVQHYFPNFELMVCQCLFIYLFIFISLFFFLFRHYKILLKLWLHIKKH